MAKRSMCVEIMSKLPSASGLYKNHRNFCRSSGIPAEKTIAIGQHSDGVPFQKGQSLECYSWNMVAIPWQERWLFTCLEKQFFCRCGCSGRHTITDILAIFVWCLKCLFVGTKPTCRHDGSPFTAYDRMHGRKSSYPIPDFGFWALLMEMRGDWVNYKGLFGFKGWSGEEICWCCPARKSLTSKFCYLNFSMNAPWRFARNTTAKFIALMVANGVDRCATFDAPGFTIDYIMVGVRHCLDLGVSQEAIGNLFWRWISSPKVPGGNQEKRLNRLWDLIKGYYRVKQPSTRIGSLTKEMVRRPGKPPKFQGKGAETRHLIPFTLEVCQALIEFDPCDLNHEILELFRHLNNFYNTFGQDPFPAKQASESCRLFLLLYREINATTTEDLWKVKPKFHMMAELGGYQVNTSGDPSRFWAYADESFVGLLAKIGSSRGGKRKALTTPTNVLTKYRSLN